MSFKDYWWVLWTVVYIIVSFSGIYIDKLNDIKLMYVQMIWLLPMGIWATYLVFSGKTDLTKKKDEGERNV